MNDRRHLTDGEDAMLRGLEALATMRRTDLPRAHAVTHAGDLFTDRRHPADCPCRVDRWADLRAITARATGGRP